MVHLNRYEELKNNIKYHAPYVDRVVVSDGESTDGSLEWLRGEGKQKYNIETIVKKQYRYPYGDHTPEARNPYLRVIDHEKDTWMLCMDTDEFIDEEGLRKLPTLIAKAEKKGYDEIRFQAHDIWTYENGEVYDNVSNYWKQDMLVKVYPGMKYMGHTHSGLYRPGAINRWAKSGYEYLHKKTERQMWKNSTFLYWTTCGVAQNRTDDPSWYEFHEIMSKNGFEDWHDFNRTMEAGHIPYSIKDWFIEHKDADNPEIRAWFVYYFIFLHPEENTDNIYNRDKDWDYLKQARFKRESG